MATTEISHDTLLEWRRTMFEEMGFTSGDAVLLSVGKDHIGFLIDTHKVRKMVEAGCTHHLALLILL